MLYDLADFPTERLSVNKSKDFYNLSMNPGRPKFVLPPCNVVEVALFAKFGYAKVAVQLTEADAKKFDELDRQLGVGFQRHNPRTPWSRQLRLSPHLTLKLQLDDVDEKGKAKKPAALRRIFNNKQLSPDGTVPLVDWFETKIKKYEFLTLSGEIELPGLSAKFDKEHDMEVGSLNMPVCNAAVIEILKEKPEGLVPLPERKPKAAQRYSDKQMAGLQARAVRR